MGDRRRKDVAWNVAEENGAIETWERVGVAVLMDIRDELKLLNRNTQWNHLQIVRELRGIRRDMKLKRSQR